MSILNRLRLNGHLDDAALAAIWTDASLAGGAVSHPHLHACPSCRTRFAAFATWLDEVRDDAAAEADAAFPADRLAAQHAQVFRRLEAAERPARVIRFPKFARPLSSGTSQVRKWIATSAAAGLFVGLGLGQMMDLRRVTHLGGGQADVRVVSTPAPDRDADAGRVQQTLNDAAFMADIDESLTRPAVAEFRAIDALTPRAPFLEDRVR